MCIVMILVLTFEVFRKSCCKYCLKVFYTATNTERVIVFKYKYQILQKYLNTI